MKTQDELRAEFQRLFDADLLEEASAVLKLIEPMSLDDLKRMLDEAPLDDEPLTEKDIARLRAAEERRRSRMVAKPAG